MNINFSIIIPIFNNFHFTKAALSDLSNLPPDHEIIIIDNGSTDDTVKLHNINSEIDMFLHPNLKVIKNSTNEGFAKACNKGYAHSIGQYVMFLNNDIRVSSNKDNWTKEVINNIEDDVLYGPTIGILDQNLKFIEESNKASNINKENSYVYMSGWCILATKNTWEKLKFNNYIGPFTEEFQTYYEDTDLSLRAKELNIKLKLINIPVRHLGKATSRKIGISKLYLPAKAKFMKKWKNKISKN